MVSPKFEQNFTETKITEGEDIKLTAKVSGNPVPDVIWQKGGKPIREGRRIKIDKSKNGVHSLRIPRAQADDGGEYTCIARNKAGEASCSAKLTVEGV